MNLNEIDREDFRNLLTEIHQTHMPFGMFGKEKYPPRGVTMCEDKYSGTKHIAPN